MRLQGLRSPEAYGLSPPPHPLQAPSRRSPFPPWSRSPGGRLRCACSAAKHRGKRAGPRRPSGPLEVAVRNLPWRAAWRETRKPPYVALVSVFASVPYGWTERFVCGREEEGSCGVEFLEAPPRVRLPPPGRREFGEEAPGLGSWSP